MAARDLRYAWFDGLRQRLHAQAIAVAHHADDNIETLLLNLVRGTGLRGLTGIPRCNGAVVRPLLGCSRQEIEQYLADHHLHRRVITIRHIPRSVSYSAGRCGLIRYIRHITPIIRMVRIIPIRRRPSSFSRPRPAISKKTKTAMPDNTGITARIRKAIILTCRNAMSTGKR